MDWSGATIFTYVAYGYCILGIITYYIAGVRYAQAAATVRSALRSTAADGDPAEPRP
jgi:hypothetical protein